MNANEHTNSGKSKNHYTRFVAMLACSFIAMYITMYLNTYEWDHVWFSLTTILYGLSWYRCDGHHNVCGNAWYVSK